MAAIQMMFSNMMVTAQACLAKIGLAKPAERRDANSDTKPGPCSHRKDTLTSLYAVYRLARKPDDVRFVFMIGNSQDNIAEVARKRGELRDPFAGDAALESMWQERYHPEHYDISDLLRLPADTLGGAYARHMTRLGLRPDFYDDVTPRHKLHYLRLRLRQTHDIWHILTGFDTCEFGEVGLQAFYFAQVTNGQSALIGAGAILKSVLRARFGDLERFVEVFCVGYGMGRRARSLLAVKWEEIWDESLEELQQRYAIVPAAALS